MRRIVALLYGLLSIASSAAHGGHSHGQGGHSHDHDDDVTADTIKLHRIANDPVVEDVDLARRLLTTKDASTGESKRRSKRDIDVDYQHPRTGQSPLMAACLGGKAKLAAFLLEEGGADPMVPEKDGYHSVHGAGFQGRADVMQVLLDYGVDVRHRHRDGYEPLHRACWGPEPRHADTVALLIGAGAVPADAPSADGKTCLDMTTNQKTLEVLRGQLGTGAKQQEGLSTTTTTATSNTKAKAKAKTKAKTKASADGGGGVDL